MSEVSPNFDEINNDVAAKQRFLQHGDRMIERLMGPLSPELNREIMEAIDPEGELYDQGLDAVRKIYVSVPFHSRHSGEDVHYEPYDVCGSFNTIIAFAENIKTYTQDEADILHGKKVGDAYDRLDNFFRQTFERINSSDLPIPPRYNISASPLFSAESLESYKVLRQELLGKLYDPRFVRELAREDLQRLSQVANMGLEHKPASELLDDLMGLYLLTTLSGKPAFYQQVATKLLNIGQNELMRYKNNSHVTAEITSYLYGDVSAELVKKLRNINREDPAYIPAVMRATLCLRFGDMIMTQLPKAEMVRELTWPYFMIRLHHTLPSMERLDRDVEAVKRTLAHFGLPAEIPSEKELTFDVMQLDWEILPPGELEKNARGIVDDAQRGNRKPRIDLERLKILEAIREEWGPDDCYYTRGRLKKRHVVRDETGNEQPDEYIVLVLQQHDPNGAVTQEHVIAESPIAGPNALYIYRQDAKGYLEEGKTSWRTVMSMTKTNARKYGARRIIHEAPLGLELVPYMVSKVKCLLLCPPNEYKDLRFSGVGKDGTARTRLIGSKAVSFLAS